MSATWRCPWSSLPPDGRALQVSVVVPAYNAEATLGACLAALDNQTLPRHTYEVLVVDDGSRDKTAAVAHGHAAVRLFRQPHQGAAAARNLGARQAAGDIVAYTDADCRPAPDWLEHLIAPLRADRGVTATRGVYRTEQRALVARFVQVEYEERYARAARRPSLDFVDTYAAAYRREALLAAGGFDTAFAAATVEDHELSYRLAALGCLMIFTPRAAVSHQHVTTIGAYARRKWRIGRDKVRVHARHPAKLAGDSHTPLSLSLQVALGLLLAPALAACPLCAPARRAAALLGLLFAASTLPLTRRAWRADRPVALVAPALVLVRAAALVGGLLTGLATRRWASRRAVPRSRPRTRTALQPVGRAGTSRGSPHSRKE